jgi:PAS domain S-box-containing protein
LTKRSSFLSKGKEMQDLKDTILYIDDDDVNLLVFSEFFLNDYQVITTESTTEARKILQTEPVKVIISDHCMPNETGLEFFERISPDYPHLIKIILTAFDDRNTAIAAINAGGIYKYILKPWDSKDLKLTIDDAIAQFNLKEENRKLVTELQQKNKDLELAYNKIKESEAKFYSIFSESNDCIHILNFNNEIVEANPAFYRLVGLNQKYDNLETLNRVVNQKYAILKQAPAQQSNNNSISEHEFYDDKGEKKYVELNSKVIQYNDVAVILTITRNITERRLMEKQIMDAIIKTQEDDQAKYARELHDGLGPILSTLKMHLEWIANPENSLNRDKIIHHTIQGIDEAIRNVKEIANNLSPHILQRFGLVNAIQSYIDNIKNTSDIEFVVTSNLKETLPGNVEIILYRTISECINNAIKHSQAKKVIIKFYRQKENLQIGYSDNGTGFNYDKVISEGRGMGLSNIQSRIKHIGGECKINSIEHQGTDIQMIIDI